MSLTLSEARSLTPGDIVHFGDESALYEVKLVAVGPNTPVYVMVDRYPDAVDGLNTYFTDLQLDLVTYVGKGKHETPSRDTSGSEETPGGNAPVGASLETRERASETRERADQSEAGDPDAGAAGSQTFGASGTASPSLEIPRAETSRPDQGDSVHEDLKPRRKYKRG